MSEKDIAHPSLGVPSGEVGHNAEISNGQCYTANLYAFRQGDTIIFSARCVQGQVTQIWDTREHHYVLALHRDLTVSHVSLYCWTLAFRETVPGTPVCIDYEKYRSGADDDLCREAHFTGGLISE